VPLQIIGLRKGEKLHEDLFYDQESVRPTSVPKILRGEMQAPPTHVREDVRGLLSLARQTEPEELTRILHEYVRVSSSAEAGLWGVIETGDLTHEPVGTRPVVVPSPRPALVANGSPAGTNGSRPTRPFVAVPVERPNRSAV
jgi:hypothetical protein